MNIREEENITQYLDSTYLKTGEQADISDEDNYNVVISTIQEAIDNNFKLVMIRPEFVSIAREMIEKVTQDIIEGTKIGLDNNKMVKWIIETGALSKEEIEGITSLISDEVMGNFPGKSRNVFVKTSTGFYNGTGANVDDVSLMKSVSGDLPIKASGGVYNRQDLDNMVKAGATRVGTSRAYDIYKGKEGDSSGY